MRRIFALTLALAIACVAPAAVATAATPGAGSAGTPAGWWSTVTELVEGWTAALAGSSGIEAPVPAQELDGTTPLLEGETEGSEPTEDPGGESISGWTPWG